MGGGIDAIFAGSAQSQITNAGCFFGRPHIEARSVRRRRRVTPRTFGTDWPARDPETGADEGLPVSCRVEPQAALCRFHSINSAMLICAGSARPTSGGSTKTKWGRECGCPGLACAPQQMKGNTAANNPAIPRCRIRIGSGSLAGVVGPRMAAENTINAHTWQTEPREWRHLLASLPSSATSIWR